MPSGVQSAVLPRRQVGRCRGPEYLWNTEEMVSISYLQVQQLHSQQLEVRTFPAPVQIEYPASCRSILAAVVISSDVRCTKAAVAVTAVAAVLQKRVTTVAVSRVGMVEQM